MTPEDSQTETGKGFLACSNLLEGTSESTRAKTAQTFLDLLGARVRNPNTRSAYRVAWRAFLAFCSARQLELENAKAYHVGSWLDQHPGSRSTQRQHLAAVRLLFDSLMTKGLLSIIQPSAPGRRDWFRESSHTPVFEEAEIVAFLDSIYSNLLKDIRDKAIFCVLLYSWCRVSALINLTVAEYYERGGTRWLRFQEKRRKEHEVPVLSKAKEAVDLWLERSHLASNPSAPLFPFPKIDFVKMDVDGFETEVLTGGMQTLRRDLPTICLELAPYALDERGSSLTELLAALKGLGYYLVNVERLDRLPDDSALLSKQIADGSGINVLAVAANETSESLSCRIAH